MVDEAHQVIAATGLSAQAADAPHLPDLLDATIANAGMPARFLADAGYWSDGNYQVLLDANVDGYIATGRLKHNEEIPSAPRGPIPKNATPKQRMARKLRTKKGKAVYARRKVIPEPVFGHTKTLQNAGQLLVRGHDAARARRRSDSSAALRSPRPRAGPPMTPTANTTTTDGGPPHRHLAVADASS